MEISFGIPDRLDRCQLNEAYGVLGAVRTLAGQRPVRDCERPLGRFTSLGRAQRFFQVHGVIQNQYVHSSWDSGALFNSSRNNRHWGMAPSIRCLKRSSWRRSSRWTISWMRMYSRHDGGFFANSRFSQNPSDLRVARSPTRFHPLDMALGHLDANDRFPFGDQFRNPIAHPRPEPSID